MKIITAIGFTVLLVTACGGKDVNPPGPESTSFSVSYENVLINGRAKDAASVAAEKAKVETALKLTPVK